MLVGHHEQPCMRICAIVHGIWIMDNMILEITEHDYQQKQSEQLCKEATQPWPTLLVEKYKGFKSWFRALHISLFTRTNKKKLER